MIALYTFTPLYCPSCGSKTGFEEIDTPNLDAFNTFKTITCVVCQVMYQKASEVDLLRAATASGGDMLEYFLEEDNTADSGNGSI